MSWKLRRAHYYQRQRGGSGADEGISKWINFWLLVGISLIFIFISLALGGAVNDDENPIVMLFGILGLLSFLITPFVFILACIADTPRHGLPNFSSSQRVKGNQGEDTWDRWIREDKDKKKIAIKHQ